MKRTIQFVGKTHSRTTTYSNTIKLGKFKRTKLYKPMVKTDLGYIDIAVSLDRWGRLLAVQVENSKGRL